MQCFESVALTDVQHQHPRTHRNDAMVPNKFCTAQLSFCEYDDDNTTKYKRKKIAEADNFFKVQCFMNNNNNKLNIRGFFY